LLERLKGGDADMTSNELQAAIDCAESKRRELQHNEFAAEQWPKVHAIVPRAAELYRRQIAQGINGNPEAARKVVLSATCKWLHAPRDIRRGAAGRTDCCSRMASLQGFSPLRETESWLVSFGMR
jgi:hypothetical protein